jgi:hypothetical protein
LQRIRTKSGDLRNQAIGNHAYAFEICLVSIELAGLCRIAQRAFVGVQRSGIHFSTGKQHELFAIDAYGTLLGAAGTGRKKKAESKGLPGSWLQMYEFQAHVTIPTSSPAAWSCEKAVMKNSA